MKLEDLRTRFQTRPEKASAGLTPSEVARAVDLQEKYHSKWARTADVKKALVEPSLSAKWEAIKEDFKRAWLATGAPLPEPFMDYTAMSGKDFKIKLSDVPRVAVMTEHGHDKFYVVAVYGERVLTIWGRRRTEGKRTVNTYKSDIAAKVAADTVFQSKLRKGYKDVTPT